MNGMDKHYYKKTMKAGRKSKKDIRMLDATVHHQAGKKNEIEKRINTPYYMIMISAVQNTQTLLSFIHS